MTRTTPRRLLAALAVLAVLLACAGSPAARGGPVPYRGAAALTGASPSDRPQLDGTVVAQRSVPFILIDARFDAAYDLVLHNTVVRERETGTLDFYYQLTNESDLPVRLIDLDTGPFTRPDSFDPIEALTRHDAPGRVGPAEADRERSQFDGVLLTFPPTDSLAPGESSHSFVLRTTATRYDLAGLTQFRATPGHTSRNGFAITYNPVLDGPLVPPPAAPAAPGAVPAPPALWMALAAAGAAGAAKLVRRATRRIVARPA